MAQQIINNRERVSVWRRKLNEMFAELYASIGGAAVWGNIGGDLADQEDLAGALGDKEDAGVAAGLVEAHEEVYDHSKLEDVYGKLPKAQEQSSGTAVAFTTDKSYGKVATPETGNITADLTNAVHGAVVLVIHQNATEPTYAGTFQKLSGSEDYDPAKVNLIYIQYIDATHQKYTIAYDE